MTRHYLFGSPAQLVRPRRFFNNDTILHVAAQSGRDEVVRFLLDEVKWLSLAPGTPHETFLDGSKRSPLHVAAANGHTHVIRRLIPVMAQLCSVQDVTGSTPLMLALQGGHIQTAQFIVDTFEDVGAACVSRRGLTALHLAAAVGATEVATRLLTHFGAQVDAHVSSTVVAKRKLVSSSSRPTGDDRQELLRFFRAVRSKYSRVARRRRSALLPTYERTTRVLHGPTPLLCALTAMRMRGPATASLLLVHGAGSTFISDTYLSTLLTLSLSNKQWDISGALVRLMGTAAQSDGTALAVVCAEARRFGPDCVRWLVDRKVGTENAYNALQEVTKRGDIKTVKYLLDNTGTLTHHSAAGLLAHALHHRQLACVEEYIRRGAPLTNVDEEKSPLIIAARLGLEHAVRGLASLPALTTFDAVNALVVLLRTATSTLRRRHAHAEVDSWNAMGLSLLRRVILTDAHVHPVELLHLACATGLFKVAEAIMEKLVALPTDARVTIIRSAPSAPQRPFITVTPKPALPRRKVAPEANGRKRKPLFKAPLSFERFVCTPPSPTILEHRRVYRDAFSFLAEHGQRDIIESLIVDVRLSPWRGGDLRGWNAVDYALAGGHYDTAVVLVGSGVMPLKRHAHNSSASKCGLFCIAAAQALARLIRSGELSSAATSLRTLLEVIAELGYVEVLDDVLQQLCVTLRQSNLQQLPWVLSVVRAAVQHHQLGTLTLLLQHFVADLGAPLSDGGEELLLCAVCSKAPQAIIHALLSHRVAVHVPSPLSKDSQRLLKAIFRDGFDGKTKLIAAAAAAALGAHDTLDKILTAGGAPTTVSSDAAHDLISASVQGSKRDLDGKSETALLHTVEALLRLGASAPPLATVRLAAQKGFARVVRLLLLSGGIAKLLKEDFDNCVSGEGLAGSIIFELMHHKGSTAADEILPLAITEEAGAHEPEDVCVAAATETNALVAAITAARAAHASEANIMLARAIQNNHIQTSVFLSMIGFTLARIPLPIGRCVDRSSLCMTLARVVFKVNAGVPVACCARALLTETATGSHVQLVRMMLHANRALKVIVDPLEALLAAAVSGGSRQVLALALREAEEMSTSVASTSLSLVQAIIGDALFGRSVRSFAESLLSVGTARGAPISSNHVPVPLWQALSACHQPLLSVLMRNQSVRCCVLMNVCTQRLVFTRVTPITLATALGNEQLVLELIRTGGASVTCQSSEMGSLQSSLTIRQEKFGAHAPSSGTVKWKRSVVSDGLQLNLKKSGALRAASHIGELTSDAKTSGAPMIDMCCRVSPIIIATRMFAVAHNIKRPVVIQRYTSLLRALIRRGALTRDLLDAVAIVVIRYQCWDLVSDIIEEGVRLSNVHESTDRFFRSLKVDDIPLLLRPLVGGARHVLHVACRFAARDVIILLARHCVRQDVESSRDARGRTPMFYTLLNPSNIEGLETLNALQVPTSALCDYATRRTPLMIASQFGNASAVANLLKFGNVDVADVRGNTALMLGALSGKQDVVELLLSAQADTTLTNDRGLTATMLAAAAGLDHIALPMAQHFSRLSSFHTSTTTLLHCAAMGGCQRVVDYILRTYDSLGIFQEDSCGMTPVYLAYAFGRGTSLRHMLSELQHRTESATLAIDEQLLNCDSRIHRFGWLSQTLSMGGALMQESKRHAKFSSVPFQLACAPKSDKLRRHRSRLLWCARNRCVVGVRVLADLNVCDDCFALHAAARRGSLDVAQLLVALRMSDPNLRDKRGFLPIEHAVLADQKETAMFLLQQMRVSVDTIHQSIQHSGTSLLHVIAMSGCHSVLSGLVPMLLQQGTEPIDGPASPIAVRPVPDALAAEATLSVLLAEDEEGRTPFEVAVLFGSAATTLRIAQAIQQVSALSGKDTTITIPSALFELRPCISPSVRAALYDFFDVEEVFTQTIFAETFNGTRKRRYAIGGDAGDRLLFSDVRMIGVASMRADAFCAPKLDQVYTIDRERQVLKQLVSAMDLPFRLKFRPDGLKGLSSVEQVDVLQRLCTSTLLGKYLSLPTTLHPVGTLELESVQKRTEVGVALQGTTVIERFQCTRNALHTVDLHAAMVDFHFIECRKELTGTQTILKGMVKTLRELSHPQLKTLVMRVDWNGLQLDSKRDTNAETTDAAASVLLDPTEHRDQLRIAIATVRYLNTEVLPELKQLLCFGALADSLKGITSSDLSTVDCTSDKYQTLTMRCYKSMDHVPNVPPAGPNEGGQSSSTLGQAPIVQPLFEGRDIVIPFIAAPSSATQGRSVAAATQLHSAALCDLLKAAVCPLRQLVQKDVVMLGVQKLRDIFVQDVHELLLASAAMISSSVAPSPLRFKLEVEDSDMSKLPLDLLQSLLADTVDALRALLGTPRGTRDRAEHVKRQQAQRTGPSSWKYLTSSRIVAQSVASSINAVTVLFSNRRQPIVRRSGSRLMLCFTPSLAPNRHEIEQSIRADTVEMELERLKELIPQTVHDMSQRLNTYLPTTSLVVDLPSLTDLPSDEDVLAALALLNHDRSAVILQELIRGVSVGWDTKLGSLIRRHVRTLTVTLQRSGANATVSLQSSGNLVIHYPLQCVEYARGHTQRITTWAIPSSQQIASLLLLQLGSLHPEVRALVDVTKGYACWCKVNGAHARRVVAGDVRCHLALTVRNVLNMPPKNAMEETFEFVSDRSLSSLRVKRHSASGSAQHTTYLVRFSAPTDGPFLNLAVRLHGQHLLNSPLRIRVLPAACSPARTTCTSAFNCIVANEKVRMTFQLHDRFGNPVRFTPTTLHVDGPSPNNPDGVAVSSWSSKIPGVVSVLFSVSKEGTDVPISIRFQVGGESHVVVKSVEVVSPETYKAILDIRKGSIAAPNEDATKSKAKAKLYFRAAIRTSEQNKKQRACRLVGGVKHRKFPTGAEM